MTGVCGINNKKNPENYNINLCSNFSNILGIKGLDKILELTYTYRIYEVNGKKIYFNEDIFEVFGGKYLEDDDIKLGNIDFDEIKKIISTKINSIIGNFNTIINYTKNSYLNEIEKNIIIKGINVYITTLEFFLNSLDFELEKAGYNHNLSEREIQSKIKKNEEYEEILYGGKISNNEYESILCYYFLLEEAKKIKRNNTIENYNIFITYLDKIKNFLNQKGYNLNKEIEFGNKKHKYTNDFLKIYGKKRIKRHDYMKSFNKILKSNKLKQTAIISNAGSIYDGPNKLEIPKDSSYNKISIENFFDLILHEIYGHYVNQRNHELFFGEIRGPGNVRKEEGLAILLEKIGLGEHITSINPISINFCRILAGEILSSDEYIKFVEIFSSGLYEITLLRSKRNYPINYIGLQHKDTTYTRGLIDIIKYITNEGGDIVKLFNGKLGIEYIKNGEIDYSNNPKYLVPFFITDLVIYKMLIKKGLIKKIGNIEEGFWIYIKRKYGYLGKNFISHFKHIRNKDNKIANKVIQKIGY